MIPKAAPADRQERPAQDNPHKKPPQSAATMPGKQPRAKTSARMSAWHRHVLPAQRKPQNHSAKQTARAGSLSITNTVRGMKNPANATITDILTPRWCAGIKIARPIRQHERRGQVTEMTSKMTGRIARLSKPDRNHRNRKDQNGRHGGENTTGTIGTTGRRWRTSPIAWKTRAIYAARRQSTASRLATRQMPTWPPHLHSLHNPPDPFSPTRLPHIETVAAAKKAGAEISGNRKARRNACTNCSPKAAWARAAKWKNGLPPAA